MALKLGIDQYCANQEKFIGRKRLGLITNPSGVDSNLVATIDRLHQTGQLVALYSPEHGVRGHIQAGEKVSFYRDTKTDLPVYSLYGETRKPTQEMLDGVDVLVIDLQDVGCRFYTYLYTMLYAMQAAAEFDLEVHVLDRPNPLGGVLIEGNVLEPEFTSFVGHPLPIRYGLTIGELALYFNTVFEINARLTVVSMEGWTREKLGDELGIAWVPPSPNIPKVETALVYPGTCFIEGTNLSEGRGTALPFEVVGAPFIDGDVLATKLNDLNLPGVTFRPTTFTPSFSKHQGEQCHGVQVHVRDRAVYRPVKTGLTLVEVVAKLYKDFEFLKPPAGGRRYFFDLLAGTDQIRKSIDAQQPLDELFSRWEVEQQEFCTQCKPFMLY